ncbi:MAG: FtsX-like permease family protein [Blastocatellia bacterium]|nr:FtsX-like permease family protein [Blastocatellia bacterium]
MNNLIAANLKHHPGRTLTSILGVAVGVVLVLLTVGLVRGMLRERGKRDANTGFELMVSLREQQGISITALPVSLPVERMEALREVPGVAAVAPVAQHLEMKGESGLGLRQVDGVDFDRFREAAGLRIVEGQPLPQRGDALIVDVKYAAGHKTRLGDKVRILDRDFTIIGVYEPETGSRMMIPLATMQELLGAPDKCSMLMIKCRTADEQEAVAQRIADRFPDLRILFTRDLPKLFAEGYSGFNVFLNVVAGLAGLISLLVILLTMYTSVTERTRQIGILKSLGASKRFIAAVFVKESLAISAIGVVCGIGLTLLVRSLMIRGLGARLDLDPDYIAIAIVGGLASGLVGSLYPALRAASQDPVEALEHY